jgi:hypothetical protein
MPVASKDFNIVFSLKEVSHAPEEREEVAFSDMNKALAALEVVGKLV